MSIGDQERLNNLPALKHFRRKLRSHMTPAEAKLWTYLKGKQLEGRKFRRQHSASQYILDFTVQHQSWPLNWTGRRITARWLPNTTTNAHASFKRQAFK